jgi:oligopeptide/dipeptide ABC transporter ATP-binding protein
MSMKELLLQVKDLKVYYELSDSLIKAVDGVSFGVRKGECLGLVGESGSGKTTVAKAILKLLPSNAKLMGGTISLKGKDITMLTEKEMDRIRWTEISLVTQSAMDALNPVARISNQMIETFLAHAASSNPVKDKHILEKCQQLFEMVGLHRNRIFDYPYQFSGGMRQRVIIAMAVALNPVLVIADEPTTALDVIMQAQIINLLKSLSEEQNISVILITHDISIIAELCQTVGVMYAGCIMEYGDIAKVFDSPFHPYTMGLKGAFPTIKELKKSLISIPGSPPVLTNRAPGCGFSDRCPFSTEQCERGAPELTMIEENHYVACHRIQYADEFREKIKDIFAARTRG